MGIFKFEAQSEGGNMEENFLLSAQRDLFLIWG